MEKARQNLTYFISFSAYFRLPRVEAPLSRPWARPSGMAVAA